MGLQSLKQACASFSPACPNPPHHYPHPHPQLCEQRCPWRPVLGALCVCGGGGGARPSHLPGPDLSCFQGLASCPKEAEGGSGSLQTSCTFPTTACLPAPPATPLTWGGRVHFLPPGGMSQHTPRSPLVSAGDHHAPPSWGPRLPSPQYICISKPHNAGGRGAVGARLGEAMWVQREGLRPPPISGACAGAL